MSKRKHRTGLSLYVDTHILAGKLIYIGITTNCSLVGWLIQAFRLQRRYYVLAQVEALELVHAPELPPAASLQLSPHRSRVSRLLSPSPRLLSFPSLPHRPAMCSAPIPTDSLAVEVLHFAFIPSREIKCTGRCRIEFEKVTQKIETKRTFF
jgi:hypothetical protein